MHPLRHKVGAWRGEVERPPIDLGGESVNRRFCRTKSLLVPRVWLLRPREETDIARTSGRHARQRSLVRRSSRVFDLVRTRRTEAKGLGHVLRSDRVIVIEIRDGACHA